MSSFTSYVKSQLLFAGEIAAAATGLLITYSSQVGPGLLTGGQAASVYTITMPANYTVPINRRFVYLATTGATLGQQVQYDEAASAANTVVVRGTAFGGGAADVPFVFEIFTIEMLS
jgi:hypothetical protein